jgi:N-acetyl-alpha-D-muramate 1-phosphate uridylyltransferase
MPPMCILAGGLGSRLGDAVRDVPKPLLEVADQPFLMHQLRLLSQACIGHVVLCVGYRGEQIEETIGHEQFGIRIDYSYDSPGLDGTLGAIRQALPHLGDRFLTLYGDTYLRIDYQAFEKSWRASGLAGAMAVLRNGGREESNAIMVNGLVTRYDKHHRTPAMEWIDYGLGGLTDRALNFIEEGVRDLADLQRTLAAQRQLFGYEAVNRYYEIGTPESWRETDDFMRSEVKDQRP